jgi:hypothetical protein
MGAPGVVSAQVKAMMSATDYGEKIDAYSHILPRKYKNELLL